MFTILSDFLKERLAPAVSRQYFYEDTYTLIRATTNIALSRNALVLQKGVLFITTHPIHKSEIMLKKEFLLHELKRKYPKLTLTDIC